MPTKATAPRKPKKSVARKTPPDAPPQLPASGEIRALVYTAPQTLEWQTVPLPTAGEGEVIVKVEATGICGSDMHAYLGHDDRRPPPLILGHEIAGRVVGSGRRVTVNPLVGCGDCEACSEEESNLCLSRQILSMPPRAGGFAEYVAVPEDNLWTVPDAFPLEQAALVEPIACGVHAVRRALAALPGNVNKCHCVVLGGGAIGLGAALSLAGFEADKITIFEPNKLRHSVLEDALDNSVADCYDICDSPTDADYADADVVIDAVGSRASRATASQLVKTGGVIVHIGLGDNDGGLDTRRLTLQEITFIGVYTYSQFEFIMTAKLVFAGKAGALGWYKKYPMARGAQAFRDLQAQKVAAAKILLTLN